MDLGVQPIDELMAKLGLTNADLVKASTQMLTFKMVQKARKGRRLTLNVQQKVLNAIRAAKPENNLALKDLFNY
jgi:hypothetical protein